MKGYLEHVFSLPKPKHLVPVEFTLLGNAENHSQSDQSKAISVMMDLINACITGYYMHI